MAREILHRLEMAQDNKPLSSEELWLKRNLKQHCLALASLERTVARFRSQIKYLKEGDANTSFFHMQARYRKKINLIHKLVNGEQVITSHEQKQEVLHEYYSNLLRMAHQRHFTLNLEGCHRNDVDLGDLDLPITDDEVRSTISSLPSNRAPGSDGYTGRFYNACWHIIKADLMAAIITLRQGNAQKLWLLNSAFLTLIPKKAEAIAAGDYRTISLMHSFAKLVTKILANRLASHLQKLVAANQSAFISGRSIHDNYMMVQHFIKSLHGKKVASLFLKLDITKAFDSVSWAFLLEVLCHLGFGARWHNLVSNLLVTSCTQVLLNGIPGDHIRHQRGLHQGDPLVPMLFILLMDVLSSLFKHAKDTGYLLGYVYIRIN
jgi:hypothetical protein